MAQLITTIPDDLDARLRSYLADHGEDLAAFTARALGEQLSLHDDPELYAELLAKTRAGMDEINTGQGMDAASVMRQLTIETGIEFDR